MMHIRYAVIYAVEKATDIVVVFEYFGKFSHKTKIDQWLFQQNCCNSEHWSESSEDDAYDQIAYTF